MIKNLLKNINTDNYSESIKAGLDFLINTDFTKIEDGKHLLKGEDYVNIQTYTTKSDADFEAHRDYIDIQYIISGEETIFVTPYDKCHTTIPYNKEKDIEFLSGEGDGNLIQEGEFMILYPDDAHKPSISADINNPQKVRKAVVKIKI